MKRTWVVYVGMSAGHEAHNEISEASWYGPFTRQQAVKLEADLNAVLDDGESEHSEAVAMPLETLTSKQVIRLAKTSLRTPCPTDLEE